MYTNICKHCKKVFKSRVKKYTCQECTSVDEHIFDEIVSYLKEYPNSNALQISEALGVDVYEIINFMNEGRLNPSRGKLSPLPDESQ